MTLGIKPQKKKNKAILRMAAHKIVKQFRVFVHHNKNDLTNELKTNDTEGIKK